MIQEHKRNQLVTDYMTEISIINMSKHLSKNKTLSKIFQNLENYATANMLKAEFLAVTKTLIQSSFPFYTKYTKQFPILTGFPNSNNNLDLTDAYVGILTSARHSLVMQQISLYNDGLIHTFFDSIGEISDPFCVWPNLYHRKMITALLSGKEITTSVKINHIYN